MKAVDSTAVRVQRSSPKVKFTNSAAFGYVTVNKAPPLSLRLLLRIISQSKLP